jgi:hypothetical protein
MRNDMSITLIADARDMLADLRMTFGARPTDEVVLRPVDGPGTRIRTSTSAIGHTASS